MKKHMLLDLETLSKDFYQDKRRIVEGTLKEALEEDEVRLVDVDHDVFKVGTAGRDANALIVDAYLTPANLRDLQKIMEVLESGEEEVT